MRIELLEKYKNHPLAKYLGGLLLLYICYHLYIWNNTQSTDNAYIDADITIVS